MPNIFHSNISLLGKWWSKFYSSENNQWKQIILHKYYRGWWRKIEDVQCSSISNVWSDIIKLGNQESEFANLFNNSFKWILGSGSKIKFWKSIWIGNTPLANVFLGYLTCPLRKILMSGTCTPLKMDQFDGTYPGKDLRVEELHPRKWNCSIC